MPHDEEQDAPTTVQPDRSGPSRILVESIDATSECVPPGGRPGNAVEVSSDLEDAGQDRLDVLRAVVVADPALSDQDGIDGRALGFPVASGWVADESGAFHPGYAEDRGAARTDGLGGWVVTRDLSVPDQVLQARPILCRYDAKKPVCHGVAGPRAQGVVVTGRWCGLGAAAPFGAGAGPPASTVASRNNT